MINFPLTKKFRATSYFKAFLLNSMNVSISTSIGYFTHYYIREKTHFPGWLNILVTIIVSFLSCLSIHILMFYIFAFGGGMLTQEKPKKEYHIFDGKEKMKNKKKKVKI